MRKTEETFLLEPERYEFRAMPMHQFALRRRDFFEIFGAGMAVFAVAKNVSAMQESAQGPHGYHQEELPKELGVAFASVRMVLADTALTPFDAGTFGSRTTPTITPQLRKVAAAARDLLVAKAAKQWNVTAEKLVAGDGKVTDPASGKSLRYAEIAREDIGAQKPPAEDPIKPASQWTVAGKPVPKVDAREFVTGGHRYSTDLRPEGMLYGKILRPPSFGATLTSYDDSAAKALKDVVLVRDGRS